MTSRLRMPPKPNNNCAVIFTDGACSGNPGPSGLGVHITYQGRTIEIAKYIGTATNNIAEYSALVLGLQEAQAIGAKEVRVFMDSELAVKQINGIYKVKNSGIKPLHAEAMKILKTFKKRKVSHVPREENTLADKLSKIGTKPETGTKRIVTPPYTEDELRQVTEGTPTTEQGSLF